MTSFSDSPVPGFYYELTEDINVIPKGVYRLEDMKEGTLIFRPGKRAVFTVTGLEATKLRVVRQIHAFSKKTKFAHFLNRYKELLRAAEQKSEPFDPHKPITMCFMDPALMKDENCDSSLH